LRYFHLCGLVGLTNALLPDAAKDIDPMVFALARVGLWLIALLAMTHYWRLAVSYERRPAKTIEPSNPVEA
jgi:hypothetical protein